ncbi:G-protein coupled receptor Mth2-like isoform X1 [Lycorma delicatula]|uniref:G-protein coupled receptor Mth2-like isoform X1 n=1 Tax=Lycorma delicatula TaxID=130591 RepID=UPI003F51921B
MNFVNACVLCALFLPLCYKTVQSLRHTGFVLNNNATVNDEMQVINRTDYLTKYNKNCNINIKPCFPKCCPIGQIFNENRVCNYSTSKTVFDDIKIYKKDNDKNYENYDTIIVNESYLNILQGLPCPETKDHFILYPFSSADEFKILDTGSILEKQTNMEYSASTYCMELYEEDNSIVALICDDNLYSVDMITEDYRHTYCGMLISVVLLFATFLVYALLPDIKNLHGKCLMNHVASLGCAYLFLAVLQIDQESSISHNTCLILSYSVIFAFLSSFFWLNVMCFDIWWVFSGYRHPAASSKKEIERKKFRLYSIYSWGSPTIIFIILVIMDMEWVPKDYIRPELGVENCFFRTDKAKLVYFYLPLAFILSSNLIFFMMTTIKICKISKETKVLNHGESKRHQEHERQRFLLYVKLFIVMGMNWITELMSFFYPDLKNLWYITDASNTLQGVLIFVIFVWKRRILRLLKLRFCPNMKFLPNTGLSRTKSQSTRSSNMMTHQTSITSTMSENVRMKSISSQSSMLSINKSPM